ncbi:MAG TPA: DUF5985 family protein [Humisphaera sp.]|jgi:hydrogenase/urease accessory protein HupE|nr:DUF5985 family protein [Humisphaera sp.]
MAEAVYLLCALTSIACAGLLCRGYFRSRARFLLWSSLCFVALAANNIVLFVDLVILPNVDLLLLRTSLALLGLLVLLFGLIWDTE